MTVWWSWGEGELALIVSPPVLILNARNQCCCKWLQCTFQRSLNIQKVGLPFIWTCACVKCVCLLSTCMLPMKIYRWLNSTPIPPPIAHHHTRPGGGGSGGAGPPPAPRHPPLPPVGPRPGAPRPPPRRYQPATVRRDGDQRTEQQQPGNSGNKVRRDLRLNAPTKDDVHL